MVSYSNVPYSNVPDYTTLGSLDVFVVFRAPTASKAGALQQEQGLPGRFELVLKALLRLLHLVAL